MKPIALLVTHDYYPSRPDRAEPDYAHTQLVLLQGAFAPYGVKIEPVFWQDSGQDWAAFSAVLPLLAWNYPQQQALFLARLQEIEAAGTMLLNEGHVLRANMDKSYLYDLATRGAPVPSTLMVEACTPSAILSSFDALAADEIIIKPRIGAGAWRQARLKRGQDVPPAELLPPEGALIQPFLPHVADEGELSMLFFGAQFSHALIKQPKAGDYRTQGQFGAVETGIDAPDGALEAAYAILKATDNLDLTYARVDLVRGPDQNWLLMELELIEPWLYLKLDRQGGHHGAKLLAQAVMARLIQGGA
jgi:glutathione synthase/RimK-type ligase-like ATP-grasp enzyme